MSDKTGKIGIVTLAAGILTCCVLALAAVACSGESSAQAKTNFCNSLSDFSSTVLNYQGLNPRTATNDEIDTAADDVYAAWDDVVNEANDWANADDNALTDAYNDLYYAIQDVPGDYTIAQSIQAVEPELSAIPGAYAETFNGSGC
jgi:hypothetical protein